jgi:hypothetical protein
MQSYRYQSRTRSVASDLENKSTYVILLQVHHQNPSSDMAWRARLTLFHKLLYLLFCPGLCCHHQVCHDFVAHCLAWRWHLINFCLDSNVRFLCIPCTTVNEIIIFKFYIWNTTQLLHIYHDINTLRTRPFNLFKCPFPGFLTILTL